MSQPAPESEGGHAAVEAPSIFNQILDLWVRPEIERRQRDGKIGPDFTLRAAQLINYADDRANELRLNDEVQAIAKVRLKDGVRKEKGDPIRAHELDGVATVVLPETEDPNCGHATMVQLVDNQWIVVFDFRYNRGRSSLLVDRARQFLAVATHALGQRLWSAFAYNLFTAAELGAKAELLTLPRKELLKSRSHKAVHSRINEWGNLGNVDRAHVTAFNKLSRLRPNAAYGEAEFLMEAAEATSLHDAVAKLLGEVESRLSREAPGRQG